MRELGKEKEWNGERRGGIGDPRDFRDRGNGKCSDKHKGIL